MENHVGVADMVLLDPLTEDALVNNLKVRFAAERIYVSKRLFCYLRNIVLMAFRSYTSQCGSSNSTISCKEDKGKEITGV